MTSKLPLRDQDGKITGLVGINRDITERKQAEDQAGVRTGTVPDAAGNLPDAIYFKDRKSRFVRVSRSKVEETLQIVRDNYRAAHPNAGPEEWPSHLAGVRAVRRMDDRARRISTFYPEARARPAYEDEQEIIRTGKPIIGKLEKATPSPTARSYG